jgi:CxxC motif-containing protein
MSKQHNLICIGCPMGCRLAVTETKNGGWLITGNICKRGEAYAIKEMTHPTRILSTTVKINNGFLPRLPVHSDAPLPKNRIFEAMRVINQVEVNAPIKMGTVIVADILGVGVNIIASRSMGKKYQI